jgi:hypothetical protein
MVDHTVSAGAPTEVPKKEGFFERLGFAIFLTVVALPIMCWIGEFWIKFAVRVWTAFASN